MIHYLKKMATWLLPYTCTFCKNLSDRTQDLCHACLRDLPILTHSCPRCANILPQQQQNLLCGQCIQTPPPFNETHALFIYHPPITKLILDLKFQHALAHARLLGELLTEKIQHIWYQNKPLPTAIVPVPLHAKRLRERGFNQALEIARPIVKQLKLPLLAMHGIRHKSTHAQTALPAAKRKQNVHRAFSIQHPIDHQHIAVIDDVITTGSTITEFCHTLKNAGIAKIDVWCCARAEINHVK